MQKGILIILDGYGEGKPYEFNAVTNAKTPTLDMLKTKSYSWINEALKYTHTHTHTHTHKW